MFKFKKLAHFSTKYAVPLAVVFVLLFIPAQYGKDHTEQNYDLSGGISLPTPSAIAGQKLKDEYKMTTMHFIIVRQDLPPVAIRDMIAKYEKVDGVSAVLGIEKFIGALIPEEFLPQDVVSIFKTGKCEMLVVLSLYPTSDPRSLSQLEEISAITKAVDPACYITGEGALTKDLIVIANNDFKRVDLVSIIAIFIIVLVLFTSISVPVILVGGIELSIMLNLGIPYFLGQSVSFMSSIVLGSIQLGVTIDYTILLVSRFKEELQAGLERKEAMRKALALSAPSILTSVLILAAVTADVALVSRQGILASICALLSRGSIISMCVIFFLLPAVLLLSENIIAKTSLNWRKPASPEPRSSKESSL
jgi:predicted RND superfamily exporter protein